MWSQQDLSAQRNILSKVWSDVNGAGFLVISRLWRAIAYSLFSNVCRHPFINFSKIFPASCPHSNLPPPTHSTVYWFSLFLISETQISWVSNFSSKLIYWINLFFLVETRFRIRYIIWIQILNRTNIFHTPCLFQSPHLLIFNL